MDESELKPKILYVENDPASIIIMKRLLGDSFDFSACETGEESIEKAAKQKFDIILLDINLSTDLNGLDVMHKIREIDLNKKTKILAVTTRVFTGEDSRLLDEGFDGYFPKPYDIESIKRSIHFLLGKLKT